MLADAAGVWLHVYGRDRDRTSVIEISYSHLAGELYAEPEQGCHCLCGWRHPDRELCDGSVPERDVRRVRFTSPTTGPVDVPMCPPCAQVEQARA